jgi:N utilization substance protein A
MEKMKGEILATLDSLQRETGLDKKSLIETMQAALLSAAKKKFGESKDISVTFKQDTGDIKIIIEGKEISMEDLGRIAAQSVKQTIMKEIRHQIGEKVYSTYQSQIGQILTGKVEAMDGHDFVIDLNEAEGILPRKECLPQDDFGIGDSVKTYLLEIRREKNFAPLFLSRTHPGFLRQLFQIEVPEIKEGIIEIKSVVREPGYRAKIAVESHMKDVDSMGACIGLKGARVRSIIKELGGEKIDIIPYDEDVKVFVARALAPAGVSYIQIFPEDKRARVIVEDDQLSLAIGKKGQNVRLAAKLTGWKLDIRSKTQAEQEEKLTPKEIEKKLRKIPGVGSKTAHHLGKTGFITIDDVARAKAVDLLFIPGLGKDKAAQIISKAKEIVEKNSLSTSTKRKQAGKKT